MNKMQRSPDGDDVSSRSFCSPARKEARDEEDEEPVEQADLLLAQLLMLPPDAVVASLSGLPPDPHVLSPYLAGLCSRLKADGVRIKQMRCTAKAVAEHEEALRREHALMDRACIITKCELKDVMQKLYNANASHAVICKELRIVLDRTVKEKANLKSEIHSGRADCKAARERLSSMRSDRDKIARQVADAENENEALSVRLTAANAVADAIGEEVAAAERKAEGHAYRLQDAIDDVRTLRAAVENAEGTFFFVSQEMSAAIVAVSL
jgi:hypothetical protein